MYTAPSPHSLSAQTRKMHYSQNEPRVRMLSKSCTMPAADVEQYMNVTLLFRMHKMIQNNNNNDCTFSIFGFLLPEDNTVNEKIRTKYESFTNKMKILSLSLLHIEKLRYQSILKQIYAVIFSCSLFFPNGRGNVSWKVELIHKYKSN